jgi:transposase
MTTRTRHWVGIRPDEITLEIAIMDGTGRLRLQVEVPNERRHIVKLFRQWAKRDGIVPDHCVFYVDDTGPNGSTVIRFLAERGWDVRTIDPEKMKLATAEQGLPVMDAAALVTFANRFPDLSQAFGPSSSRTIRLDHLRNRREQLMAERIKSANRLDGHRRHMQDEVQREFERMERRQLNLLDRFIQRIDMLIAHQVMDAIDCGQRTDDVSLSIGSSDQGISD